MSKQAKEEAWQHFVRLLESPDLKAFSELKKAVEETHAKDAWIIESLIDFYTSSDSPRALELLTSVNRELDKIVCKKLHECFEEPSRRRAALRLLVSIICRQPSWMSKITKEKIFNDCIRCLKSETDAPALMYATYAITMLLPASPDGIAANLKEVLDAFVRCINIAYSSHNSMPEMYQLNLQVGVYSLFVRLYGMYPWSLLAHVQQQCSKPENRQLYRDAMEPMFEQVRLHPLLVTTSSRDKELSKDRWLGKEVQDIVAECAALALDASEGSCRAAVHGAAGTGSSTVAGGSWPVGTASTSTGEATPPLLPPPTMPLPGLLPPALAGSTGSIGSSFTGGIAKSSISGIGVSGGGCDPAAGGISPGSATRALVVPSAGGWASPKNLQKGLFKVQSTNSMEPAADSLIAAAAASSAFFSPSENFSLSTPPLSHSTTPTMRSSIPGGTGGCELEESYQSQASTARGGMSRVGSATFRGAGSSAGGTPSAAALRATPSATPSNSQTPVTADLFTSGPTSSAIVATSSSRHSSGGGGSYGGVVTGRKELAPVVPLSLATADRENVASFGSRSNSRCEAVPPSPHRREFTAEPPADALKAPAFHLGMPTELASEAPPCTVRALGPGAGSSAAASAIGKRTDECSLSVKSLPQLLEKLSDTGSHGGSEMDDTTDEEVSSINQPASSTPAQPSQAFATAESVAAFRKTVNRIRFNSTTVTAGSQRSHAGRPKSCPDLFANCLEPASAECATAATTTAAGAASAVSKQVVVRSQTRDDASVGIGRSTVGTYTSAAATAVASRPLATHVWQTVGVPPLVEDATSVVMPSSSTLGGCDGERSGLLLAAYSGGCVSERGNAMPVEHASSSSSRALLHTAAASLGPRYVPPPPQAVVSETASSAAWRESCSVVVDGAPGPSASSSAELLDEYLRQGALLHGQLRSRLSLTDQLTTKWTHFGGSPPADEVAILQGQLMMMHTQLLYERQKREQHALRNRRLLRDVKKTVTLQEQNDALVSQVHDLEGDVLNLKMTINLQKEEQKRQKAVLESSKEQHAQQQKQKAKQMEELEYDLKDLKRHFEAQQAELSAAKKELAGTRRRLQQAEQDLLTAGGQAERVASLEAQSQSLTKQLLLMGELQFKYEERLQAAAAAASANRCPFSCRSDDGGHSTATPGGAPLGSAEQQLIVDVDRLKMTVARLTDRLEQEQQSTGQLRKLLDAKEKAVTDLKKMLEHTKAAHAGQIKAMEEKCSAMRAACQAMEQHTVDLYAQIAFLTPPPSSAAGATGARAIGST